MIAEQRNGRRAPEAMTGRLGPALARLAAGAALLGTVSACTTLPDDGDLYASESFYIDVADAAMSGEPDDPIEGINRFIFSLNLFLDDILIRPVTVVYRTVLPDAAKQGVHNFLVNLEMPVTAVNALLQGKPDRAGAALARFLTNTVAGIGGLVDVAAAGGAPPFKEDFGQTLAVYGAGAGPYLMLPVLGPSNVRDASGKVVDLFLDPFSLAGFYSKDMRAFGYGRAVAGGIDARHQIFDVYDDLRETSVDFYAALRSLYSQRREADIRDGAPPDERTDYLRDDPFREIDRETSSDTPAVRAAGPMDTSVEVVSLPEAAPRPVRQSQRESGGAPWIRLGGYALAGEPSGTKTLRDDVRRSLDDSHFEPLLEAPPAVVPEAIVPDPTPVAGTPVADPVLDGEDHAALGGAPVAEIQIASLAEATPRQVYRLPSE
jgi:phospholipid-binding lipoprotein MlaA